MNNKDNNKIVVSNKLPLGKQDLKYFTGYKDDKKLYPYVPSKTEYM